VVLGEGSTLPPPSPRPEAATGRPRPPAPALAAVFERSLDVASTPVLRSHVIDGRPVVPLALILEWLAHGAVQRNPGLAVCGLDDVRILKGIVLRDEASQAVRVLAGAAVRRDAQFVVPVELRGTLPDGREVAHARAEVVLADRLPQGRPAPGELDLPPYGGDAEAIYREVLFHGPDLQGIERVDGCGAAGISARVAAAPAPGEWIERPLRQAWLTDPLAIDCAFQLLILWCVEQAGSASLPTALGRYRQFRRAFPAAGVRVVARVTRAGAHRARADIEFLDDDGSLVARIEEYECVIDASLNQTFRRNQLAPAARG
jgi:hypothetical protein